MEKIFVPFVENGDAQSVLWLSIAIVLSVIYGLTRNKSVFWMMISGMVTLITSFSKMSLTAQLISFLAIYLCLYMSTDNRNRRNPEPRNQKKEYKESEHGL